MKKINLIAAIVAGAITIASVSCSLALYVISNQDDGKDYSINGKVNADGGYVLENIYNQYEAIGATDNVESTEYNALNPDTQWHLRYALGFEKSADTTIQEAVFGQLEFEVTGELAKYVEISGNAIIGNYPSAESLSSSWGSWANAKLREGTNGTKIVSQVPFFCEDDASVDGDSRQYFDVIIKLTDEAKKDTTFLEDVAGKSMSFDLNLKKSSVKAYLMSDENSWKGVNAWHLEPNLSAMEADGAYNELEFGLNNKYISANKEFKGWTNLGLNEGDEETWSYGEDNQVVEKSGEYDISWKYKTQVNPETGEAGLNSGKVVTSYAGVKEGDVCNGIEVLSAPTKLTYDEGEKIDLSGFVFNATYVNGYDGGVNLTKDDIDSYTPSGALTLSDNKLTVTHKGYSYSFDIVVEPTSGDVCTALTITTKPSKLEYVEGETFDPTGLVFNATYKNGYKGGVGLTYEDLDSYTSNSLALGDSKVTITHKEFSAEIAITVKPSKGDKVTKLTITKNPTKLEYTEGETFDPTGIVFTPTYSNGYDGEVDLTESALDEVSYEAFTVDDTSASISYKGFFYSFDIVVNHQYSLKTYERYGTPILSEMADGFENTITDSEKGYYFSAVSDKATRENGSVNGEELEKFENGASLTISFNSEKEGKMMLAMNEATYGTEAYNLNKLVTVEAGTSSDSLQTYEISDDILYVGTNNWHNYKNDYITEIDVSKGTNVVKLTAGTIVSKSIERIFNLKNIMLLNEKISAETIALKKYYGDVALSNMGTPTDNKLSTTSRGTVYEAENGELSGSIDIETSSTASGGKSLGHFDKGDTVTFTVVAEKEEKVLVQIGVTNQNANGSMLRPRTLSEMASVTYGTDTESLVAIESNERSMVGGGGWTLYEQCNVGEITLKEGTNYIQVGPKGDSFNIDYLSIIRR